MVAYEFITGFLGSPGIRVDAPYEVMGQLLSMYTSGRLYDRIESGIQQVQSGQLAEYETGQDAHIVRISKAAVQIEELEEYVGGPPQRCSVPLPEFVRILAAWRSHLGQASR